MNTQCIFRTLHSLRCSWTLPLIRQCWRQQDPGLPSSRSLAAGCLAPGCQVLPCSTSSTLPQSWVAEKTSFFLFIQSPECPSDATGRAAQSCSSTERWHTVLPLTCTPLLPSSAFWQAAGHRAGLQLLHRDGKKDCVWRMKG